MELDAEIPTRFYIDLKKFNGGSGVVPFNKVVEEWFAENAPSGSDAAEETAGEEETDGKQESTEEGTDGSESSDDSEEEGNGGRRRRVDDYYDLSDSFIDDSELIGEQPIEYEEGSFFASAENAVLRAKPSSQIVKLKPQSKKRATTKTQKVELPPEVERRLQQFEKIAREAFPENVLAELRQDQAEIKERRQQQQERKGKEAEKDIDGPGSPSRSQQKEQRQKKRSFVKDPDTVKQAFIDLQDAMLGFPLSDNPRPHVTRKQRAAVLQRLTELLPWPPTSISHRLKTRYIEWWKAELNRIYETNFKLLAAAVQRDIAEFQEAVKKGKVGGNVMRSATAPTVTEKEEEEKEEAEGAKKKGKKQPKKGSGAAPEETESTSEGLVREAMMRGYV